MQCATHPHGLTSHPQLLGVPPAAVFLPRSHLEAGLRATQGCCAAAVAAASRWLEQRRFSLICAVHGWPGIPQDHAVSQRPGVGAHCPPPSVSFEAVLYGFWLLLTHRATQDNSVPPTLSHPHLMALETTAKRTELPAGGRGGVITCSLRRADCSPRSTTSEKRHLLFPTVAFSVPVTPLGSILGRATSQNVAGGRRQVPDSHWGASAHDQMTRKVFSVP